jgi:hypothetical protein
VVAAAGPIAFSLRVSASRLGFAGRPVSLSIRMQTAGMPATAGIGLVTSGWPDPGVVGAPLAFGSPRLSGPGKITSGFASSGGDLAGGAPFCQRGAYSPDGGGVDVSLPADTVTTLSYTVRYAAAPWPGMTPTMAAFAYVPAVNPGGSARSLGSVRLRTVGRVGLRISLSALHVSRPVPHTIIPRMRHGQLTTIVGRIAPLVRNALVRVVAESYPHPARSDRLRRTLIGTAVTNDAGAFRINWRPRFAGAYMISAAPTRTQTNTPGDVGCDLTLDVR